jgi:putative effector of murein hydrolase LrgA (UPF0299 family)
MIRGMALLLVCQLAGEIVSRVLDLPVPGPVLGLLLLFTGLCMAGRRLADGAPEGTAADAARVADGLLQNLALLFVPAGVGVVKHLDLLATHGIAIAVALIGSTALTLIITVLVFSAVAARFAGQAGDDGEAT